MWKRLVASVCPALLVALAGGCGGEGVDDTQALIPSAPLQSSSLPAQSPSLEAILAGDHRSAENRARDIWRHPRETLEFFGLRPEMSVVEIWPGAGWYTEILAPYLRERGRHIAAHWDPEGQPEFLRNSVRAYREKLAARPDLYDRVQVVVLAPPTQMAMVEPESVDMVLTFRNVHNWMASGQAHAVFAAMYRVLKPGGVFGVVEHRARSDQPQDPHARSGYVREDHVIGLAEQAGFVLEARSDVNANPADDRDHPGGVWALPPTLRHGDRDRERYLGIGESDRFTLRFRKPGSAAGVGEGAVPVTDEPDAEAAVLML